MVKLSVATSCLLLAVGKATAEIAQPGGSERLLPQWLTGLIAVAGFLFLCFVGLLVKKAWCEETDRTRKSDNDGTMVYENQITVDETSLNMVRSKEDMNAYESIGTDTYDKVTAM